MSGSFSPWLGGPSWSSPSRADRSQVQPGLAPLLLQLCGDRLFCNLPPMPSSCVASRQRSGERGWPVPEVADAASLRAACAPLQCHCHHDLLQRVLLVRKRVSRGLQFSWAMLPRWWDPRWPVGPVEGEPQGKQDKERNPPLWATRDLRADQQDYTHQGITCPAFTVGPGLRGGLWSSWDQVQRQRGCPPSSAWLPGCCELERQRCLRFHLTDLGHRDWAGVTGGGGIKSDYGKRALENHDASLMLGFDWWFADSAFYFIELFTDANLKMCRVICWFVVIGRCIFPNPSGFPLRKNGGNHPAFCDSSSERCPACRSKTGLQAVLETLSFFRALDSCAGASTHNQYKDPVVCDVNNYYESSEIQVEDKWGPGLSSKMKS